MSETLALFCICKTEYIIQKLNPMKRTQRIELRSCEGLFHLIEQGNLFLLMWSIKSGSLSSLRRHPEAGTSWVPGAADHTPGTMTSINSDIAPFVPTEALGWQKESCTKSETSALRLGGKHNKWSVPHINQSLHLPLTIQKSICALQEECAGPRNDDECEQDGPVTTVSIVSRLLCFDSGLPRVPYLGTAPQ